MDNSLAYPPLVGRAIRQLIAAALAGVAGALGVLLLLSAIA